MNSPGHQSCGLWRHPRDRAAGYDQLGYWLDLARLLERGLFDGVFMADVSGVYDVYGASPDAALRAAVQVPANDPFTLVPAMASVTQHLCFGVTGSIPYEPPYPFARRISSLDRLTGGRIAWNVVTGYLDSAAKAFGEVQQPKHDTRYDMADEYMTLVYKLWEGSWADDAVVRDRAAGVYTRPDRVRAIDHDGEYFSLSAIHMCEPSPQRTPVIFQAGASPRGMAFAARHAECVFVAGPNPHAIGRAVARLREMAQVEGRSGADIKVFALISLVVDETDAKAQARLEDYESYGLDEGALALLSGWRGVDLSTFAMDELLGTVSSEAIQSGVGTFAGRTPRQWARELVVGGAAPVLVGAPQTVADGLQAWMETAGVDGFNLSHTVMPECVEAVVDLLVPELQRRGAYKRAYAPGAMRDKLFARGPRLAAPHPAAGYRF